MGISLEDDVYKNIVIGGVRLGKISKRELDASMENDPEVIATEKELRATNICMDIQNANHEATLEYIRSGGNYYKINPQFKYDKEITLAAVTQGYRLPVSIWDKFKEDCDIVVLYCKRYNNFLAETKLNTNPEVVLSVIKYDGEGLQYADMSVQQDRNFLLKILRRNRTLFGYIDDSFKYDSNFLRDFVKACRDIWV